MSFSPLPPPCPILHRAHAPIFSSSQINITLFLQHYTIYTCFPPKELRPNIPNNILILHIKAAAIIGQGGAIVSCIAIASAPHRSQYRIGGVIGYGWLVVFPRIRPDECQYLYIDMVSSHLRVPPRRAPTQSKEKPGQDEKRTLPVLKDPRGYRLLPGIEEIPITSRQLESLQTDVILVGIIPYWYYRIVVMRYRLRETGEWDRERKCMRGGNWCIFSGLLAYPK